MRPHFRPLELTQDTLHGITADQLSLLADRFHMTHPGAAAGRCLSASLDFAVAARRELGLDVQLIKWRVVGDPNFADHWALALDAFTVLDLTHLQVDAQLPLIGAIACYPDNFLAPQQYPAALLLDGYVASDPMAPRLSLDFLWLCGTRVLRFDMAAAARAASPSAALAALAEFGRFFLRYHAQRLSQALERRAQTLLGRLSCTPDQRSALNPARYARVGQAFTPALAAPLNSACTFLLAWISLAPAA